MAEGAAGPRPGGDPLFAGLRAHGAALAQADEPVAELLALVWGPRFDREHAGQLVALQAAAGQGGLPPILVRAADRFDALPPARQQRLRSLIAHYGLRGTGGTMPA